MRRASVGLGPRVTTVSAQRTAWPVIRSHRLVAMCSSPARRRTARTRSTVSMRRILAQATALLAAAMWTHILATAAAAATPEQQAALRDGRDVCGIGKKVAANCIEVLTDQSTMDARGRGCAMGGQHRPSRVRQLPVGPRFGCPNKHMAVRRVPDRPV